MHYFGYCILVSHFLIRNVYTDVTPVEPLCDVFNSPNVAKKRCCSGFRTIGGKCHPCIGSYGEQCSIPCPAGFYGIKCQNKCSCERCNATTGDCYNRTEAKLSSGPENGNTNGSQTWIPILLGLLGSMGSFALLFLALYVKERKTFVQSEQVVEASAREENTNNEFDQDDYDSIRESRLMLDDDSACDDKKKFKTMDRVSYAKTQTLQNPYNKLSYNRLKSRTMDFRNGELYNISETSSLKMDVGDYVTVASDKAETDPLSLKDSKGEDNDEPYNNYYSDVANRQPNQEPGCEKIRQNPNVSEKNAKGMSRIQNKKPTTKPKPTHLAKATNATNKEQNEDRPYSVAN